MKPYKICFCYDFNIKLKKMRCNLTKPTCFCCFQHQIEKDNMEPDTIYMWLLCFQHHYCLGINVEQHPLQKGREFSLCCSLLTAPSTSRSGAGSWTPAHHCHCHFSSLHCPLFKVTFSSESERDSPCGTTTGPRE